MLFNKIVLINDHYRSSNGIKVSMMNRTSLIVHAIWCFEFYVPKVTIKGYTKSHNNDKHKITAQPNTLTETV